MKTDPPAAKRILDKHAAFGVVRQRSPLAAKETIAFAKIPDRVTLDLSTLFLKRNPAECPLRAKADGTAASASPCRGSWHIDRKSCQLSADGYQGLCRRLCTASLGRMPMANGASVRPPGIGSQCRAEMRCTNSRPDCRPRRAAPAFFARCGLSADT